MRSTSITRMVWVVASALLAGSHVQAETYTASQFSAVPPFLSTSVDPFVLINLSVENTQQAEAFTDGEQTYANGTYCPGRTNVSGENSRRGNRPQLNGYGICYTGAETYIGYFNPDKCYDYVQPTGSESGRLQDVEGPWQGTGSAPNVGYFKPVADASSNHECSGRFSGNFMNWATMTALDEFRRAMTGGARLVDTSGSNAKTLLTRVHRYTHEGDWDSFVGKAIRTGGITEDGVTFSTNPSKVTPFNQSMIYIKKNDNIENKVTFTGRYGQNLGTYNVIVEVCNKDAGLEENCQEYSDPDNPETVWYKPEGVLQKNALKMRYALTSYTSQAGNDVNGGVLRSNAKYIGYYRPSSDGGLELNPQAEINQDGTFAFNPDDVSLTNGVKNSGILNYINLFGISSETYKKNDPASELYYEGLRYLMGFSPTASFSANARADTRYKDGFPVYYQSASASTGSWKWEDPVLDACQKNFVLYIGDQFTHADNYVPGKSCSTDQCEDVGFDADALTDTVGSYEGKSNLGDGTVPGMSGGYWIAGMSYWANTSDVRSDLAGDQNVKTFIVDTQEYKASPPTEADNPLWLAAKYGSFDTDGWSTGTAPTTEQWDKDGDEDPDGYTLASQPANLVKGLTNAFNIMTAQINAGSAAGVSINTAAGEGMVVQGLFKPSHVVGGRKVEWGGLMHSLFVDEHDNYREDANQNNKLDDSDPIVEYVVGDHREKATVSRYTYQNRPRYISDTPYETGIEIDEIKTLWDSRDELASLANAEVKTQRDYRSSAAGGRYIFTAIDGSSDSATDGVVVGEDVLPFTDTEFTVSAGSGGSKNHHYLDLPEPEQEEAPDIVNFIRGVEDPASGYRSRTIDYKGDGLARAWRLGDIVSSSPTVVGPPGREERYDWLYNDTTYIDFYNAYRNRRQMVYVGANDGMLHAFNAGFYDPEEKAFTEQLSNEIAHPLGSELWAYVPFNVLPHLKWLASPEYPHNYYVDGIPQVFEVNIFDDDEDHPGGWGTILVVGLRFGGSDYSLEVPGSAGSGETVTTRSSFVVMDVTNPEKAPKLVAEITHEDMGYTTSRPTIMKQRVIEQGADGDPSVTLNRWYLVMGSGPYGSDRDTRQAALADAVSNQNAKVFVFDLIDKSFVSRADGSGGTVDYYEVPNSNNGFVGDMTAVDWDGDYTDDAVYFGTVTGSIGSQAGDFMRFVPQASFGALGEATINRLISSSAGSVGKPFSGKAFVRRYGDEYWVLIGTGRFFVSDDNMTSGQMSYYGIKEPKGADGYPALGASVSTGGLLDTSDIVVQHIEDSVDSAIFNRDGSSVVIEGDQVDTFKELRDVITEGYDGWIINFDDLKARNVGKSDGVNSEVGFTEYVGSGDMCQPMGDTYLNRVFFQTGTAAPFSNLNPRESATHGTDIAERSTYYSVGLVRDVDYVDNRFIGQGSLGNLPSPEVPEPPKLPSGRVSWREINIDW